MSSRGISALLVGSAVLLSLAGCARQKQKPALEYMPDMAYGPSVRAQSEDPLTPGIASMRMPVVGTVPRGFTPYRFAMAESLLAAQVMVNPLPRTAEVLARGERVYMSYCVVCHGEKGDGQGYIVPKFPMPPSLLSPRVAAFPDGRIFHLITRGGALMPSYGAQILPEDRWAAIHFVRALSRAANPTAQDLAAAGVKPDTAKSAPPTPPGTAAGAAPAGGVQ